MSFPAAGRSLDEHNKRAKGCEVSSAENPCESKEAPNVRGQMAGKKKQEVTKTTWTTSQSIQKQKGSAVYSDITMLKSRLEGELDGSHVQNLQKLLPDFQLVVAGSAANQTSLADSDLDVLVVRRRVEPCAVDRQFVDLLMGTSEAMHDIYNEMTQSIPDVLSLQQDSMCVSGLIGNQRFELFPAHPVLYAGKSCHVIPAGLRHPGKWTVTMVDEEAKVIASSLSRYPGLLTCVRALKLLWRQERDVITPFCIVAAMVQACRLGVVNWDDEAHKELTVRRLNAGAHACLASFKQGVRHMVLDELLRAPLNDKTCHELLDSVYESCPFLQGLFPLTVDTYTSEPDC